ncbi:dienelactone hydrolase family protein [Bacillus atrophaeus]|uniref:dienelactone hydrolase family protein n=1 Tax=Bacillus atrophaeus TaxID=1452 RepID=UPI002E21ABB1|nr:dienelactone hydrolase family protein [Bacillus atrophaeus]MED1031520.1 dienelactone hydrolase family protein [Bacillus atrophaeus]MED1120352.1 dienelactone hydrolase family protein [Bacillus atrophaeus]MED1130097.1 dienelactone hydrolase family protein [Bacillus atrophaeus]
MLQKPLVILIHEIYGVNSHIKKMARLIKMAGYDVVTPNLLGDQEVYSLKEEKAAYEQFSMHNRLTAGEKIIRKLIVRNKNAGRIIYVIGFSAGATIAWKCSSMPELSGAVCYYGSRIRDHLDVHPACPVLLFFPAYEPSFDVSDVITRIKKKENRFISLYQFDAPHGFANPDSAHFDRAVFLKSLSIIADL